LFNGLGPLIYFNSTGTQTVRVQLREDGLALDQIVLSPAKYLTSSPGTTKNDVVILSRNSGDFVSVTVNPTPTPTPTPAPGSPSDVVLWTADVPSNQIAGSWTRVSDSTAAGQIALWIPDLGAPKLATALAAPASYFDVYFNAQAGVPYRLWMRAKAQANSTNNDSVWVQFSSSLNSSGGADYRIGTTGALMYNMEECTGCGLSNWGWNDTAINGLGPLVSFATSGLQQIRVQLREDGINIDQIVLSPQTYLNSSPGAFKNDGLILNRAGGTSAPPSPTPTPTPIPTPTPTPTPAPTNQAPQVAISAGPNAGIAPLNVIFNSSAYDPDGWIAAYNWNFGDGQTSTAAAPSHIYTAVGTFTARLTVTDNAGASTTASIVISTSGATQTTTATRFKILQWNVQYGKGTDNITDLGRQVNWMAAMQPDIIALNEVPPENVPQYQSLLQQRTGITWYSYWVAITPGNTVGQQILSRFPFANNNALYMSFGRSVAQGAVNIGGRTVNIFSTHLSYESSDWRLQQLSEINSWTSNFSEQKILLGDFNLSPNWAEYIPMTTLFYD
jgi:hypothetical protein